MATTAISKNSATGVTDFSIKDLDAGVLPFGIPPQGVVCGHIECQGVTKRYGGIGVRAGQSTASETLFGSRGLFFLPS